MKTNKTAAAALSVVSNSTLVAVKLAVGILSGSVAILSEAVHSGVDLIAAVIALFSVRVSGLPADEEHPFGHGKIENLSGTIEAFLIFVAAGLIVYEAAIKLFNPEPVQHLGWGIGLMALSASVNWLVSSWLFKVAREHDSVALEADAQHLSVDVWTSLSVLIGLGLMAILSSLLGPKYETIILRLDPIIALTVAIQIVKVSIKLTREAGAPLLDGGLPSEEVTQLSRILFSDPRVVAYHKLRTRKAGAVRHIDVHLIVPENMSLAEGHKLAEEVEDRIRDRFQPAQVITHVEPSNDENINVASTTYRNEPAT